MELNDNDSNACQVRYKDSEYEIELAKLRLESQEFLSQAVQKEKFAKIKGFLNLEIKDLRVVKPNSVIEYLDIVITPDSSRGGVDDKKQMRVYPGRGNTYELKLITFSTDLLEIEVSKGQAYGGIDLKSFEENKILTLYNKQNRKFGTILITKNSMLPSSSP